MAFTQRFRVAVSEPARHPISVKMGSRCCSCPSVEEEQPSQAANAALVSSTRGNSGSAVGTPVGTGTVAAQQD